jgi:hypothetical protein
VVLGSQHPPVGGGRPGARTRNPLSSGHRSLGATTSTTLILLRTHTKGLHSYYHNSLGGGERPLSFRVASIPRVPPPSTRFEHCHATPHASLPPHPAPKGARGLICSVPPLHPDAMREWSHGCTARTTAVAAVRGPNAHRRRDANSTAPRYTTASSSSSRRSEWISAKSARA